MKILNLLETQRTPTIYAYHATTSNNLKTIISSGLQPNFKDGKYASKQREVGYGSSAKSPFGYPLTSLSGVYFTRSYKKAVHIANVISTNNAGIIIICKVQPKQLELDEDLIDGHIINERELLKILKSHMHSGSINPSNDFPEHIQSKIAIDYGKEVLENLGDMLNTQQRNNALPYIIKCIRTLISYFINSTAYGMWDDSNVKQAQQELTVKLRPLLHKPTKIETNTFKLNAPVTFSGSNKIVGIYNTTTRIGWGDLGALAGSEYNLVDTPMELLTSK